MRHDQAMVKRTNEVGLASWAVSTPALRNADASPLDARLRLGYGAGLAIFLLAFFIRLGLDEVLPPGFPFLTFFPAVIITAFVFGLWPGIMVAVLSTLASWLVFLPTAWTFDLDGRSFLALVFFVSIAAVDIALIHTMHTLVRRLTALKTEADHLAEQRGLYVAELDHRIKNLFGTVSAIVGMAARQAATPADLGRDVRSRIEALARVSGLLRGFGDASRTTAVSVLHLICDPLVVAADRRITLDNLDHRIDLPTATSLSLIVHELATNAVKHGSLAQESGSVVVTGKVEAGAEAQSTRLKIHWQERGGPAAAPAGPRGFGSALLERVTAGLGHPAEISHTDEGYTVTFGVQIDAAALAA